jgi:four helix bundle protein
MEGKKEDNIILTKTFDFSLSIIALYKILINKNEFILSKQILRSGTSIGANVEEAIGAHSKKDFVSKMIIAYKEARETKYWLRLLDKSQLIEHNYSNSFNDIDSICNILTAIIKSSKNTI